MGSVIKTPQINTTHTHTHTQTFYGYYGHYTDQPVLTTNSIPSKNWGIMMQQFHCPHGKQQIHITAVPTPCS